MLDLLVDQPLDRGHQRPVFAGDQRHGFARAARAAGAADAVHVILGDVRQVVVHDVRQRLDVQAARGDVGGDQHLQLVVLEALERARARRLALVAVDGDGVDAVLPELLGEAVGAVLGLGEHQHLLPAIGLDEVREQRALAVLVHRVGDLGDELDRRIAPRDLDGDRVVQELAGELADVVGEGRREQEVLALGRQQREDAADVADEAHVEHAVGLVQHQDFHLAQVDGLLLQVIEQPSGGGDDDVNAAAQLRDLRIDAHAAVDDRRAQLQMLAVGTHAFLHLRRELAGGHEHEGAHRMARGRVAGVGTGREQLQHRQRESCRLAGAGLRGAEQVFAREYDRDGLRLDRGGLGIALLGDSAEQLGRKAEILE